MHGCGERLMRASDVRREADSDRLGAAGTGPEPQTRQGRQPEMKSTDCSWKNMELPEDATETLSLEFEVALVETALEKVDWKARGSAGPSKKEIGLLVALGNLYARLKQHDKGIEVDRILINICPDDPCFYYNLACSHSLLGQVDEAIRILGHALELGYDNFKGLQDDSDLDNLREDPRYRDLLGEFESTL